MKLPQTEKFKWNYRALAFAIPFFGMLMVMLVSQYEPFGKYSMLYSDMYHQYYPLFVSFRKALLSGDSLLYTWSIGMGLDHLGLISYYLASPLNLLSVLVPEGLLLEYFSLLMPIKLGLAGLFFAIFLRSMFDVDDLSITLFGCFYALCAWALGYQWNVMWLDTFALLPLVALGTIRLLRDKKFFLYTVTLFLSIYANYYIGFFICIFVLLLFFCYQISRWKGFRRFFSDLCRIALFSFLAIGMTAILELPTLAALQTTQSSVNSFPEGFRLNIASENTWKGLLGAMCKVAGNMSGGLEPTFKEGLPNLYCGVGSVMLAVLFLLSKKVKLSDKICSIFLLLFFMVSFIIRQLDYIWHGFHFTNMIPYRFSFLFSFVLLYMAYRAYLNRDEFKAWHICIASGCSLLLFSCSGQRSDTAYLAYNLVFLLLYVSVLMYGTNHPSEPGEDATKKQIAAYQLQFNTHKSTAATLMAGVLFLEIVLNLVNFGVCFPGTGVSNYPKGTEYSASMIRYMKEREDDNPFYRAEVTHSQTLNDGAINGYNGISAFTSSANVRVTEFMRALGYGAKNTYNRYCFEESSPVANLFLNLKYMLERDADVEDNSYFTEIHHYGDVYLLENNAYLPLGFLANAQLANVEFSLSDGDFDFQNTLLKYAAGISQDVWHTLGENTFTISSSGNEIRSQTGDGYCSYQTQSDAKGSITYSYIADQTGLFCIDLDLKARNSFTVSINGKELYAESHSLPQMLAVCEVIPGDIITINLTTKADENSNMSVSAAILNRTVFDQAYQVLNASTLEIDEFRNTYVSGTIDCNRTGLLYTSIPQNGNWSATVDGKETQIVLVGDAMIGLALTEGYHEIEFIYHNKAFALGWKVSFLCLGIFLLLSYKAYKPRKRHGKYESRK